MAASKNEKLFLNDIEVLVFDIVGTLVDSDGTMQRETTAVFAKYGIDKKTAHEVSEEWMEKQTASIDAIVEGRKPWIVEDEVRREVLTAILEERGITVEPNDFECLATVGRRFLPWDGATRQLAKLCSFIKTTGLTNSGFAQIVEVSARADFRWHALLSGQFASAYKPDPAAYQLAIDSLEIVPAKALFISTHPWDLRAAQSHGFRTAYLPREHAQNPNPDDSFDLYLETLDDLINMLHPSV